MTAAPRVLGIAGYSGSGKTTLITGLLPRLKALGLAVGTLKHSHHGFDVLAKDHFANRLRAAGALEVLVAGADRYALTCAPTSAACHPLSTVATQCAGCDLVLVEGFKHHAFPKMEVWRPSPRFRPLAPADPYMVALATTAEGRAQAPAAPAVPLLDLDDHDAIAAFILRYCEEGA